MHGWHSESTDGPKGRWSCVFWSSCSGCSHNCWMQCGVVQLQSQLQCSGVVAVCSAIIVVKLQLQLWCGLMSVRNVMQCNVLQCCVLQRSLMQCSVLQCCVLQCSLVQRSLVQCSVKQCSCSCSCSCSCCQCSVAQRDVVQLAQCSVAQCRVISVV